MASIASCLNEVLNFLRREVGLTLSLGYKAGPPCTNCYCHDDLLHVPNSDAGGAHECPVIEDNWIQGTGHTCGAQSREKQRKWLKMQMSKNKANRMSDILTSEIFLGTSKELYSQVGEWFQPSYPILSFCGRIRSRCEMRAPCSRNDPQR